MYDIMNPISPKGYKKMSVIKKIFKRYFIDALGAMALGLFSSLIIATIIGQIAKIPVLDMVNIPLYGGSISDFLTYISSDVSGAKSAVVGAAIGVAIAWGLKKKPLVLFSSAVVGAFGYLLGGPFGAYVAAVVGAEIGGLVAGKTKLDIVITPFITIIPGCLVGAVVGPPIGMFMDWLGSVISSATELAPIPMGMAISVLVGLALTAPISSAAICVSIGINGIAAGAACVGCSCQMVGFAVASFRDNGFGGLVSQGVGTSMIQFPNIMKRPQIWIAPTLASFVLGPISTAVFGMTNNSVGAGMGTSGLVGQFNAFATMTGEGHSWWYSLILILVMHFVLPAVLTLLFDFILRKIGWIKKGDMTLQSI